MNEDINNQSKKYEKIRKEAQSLQFEKIKNAKLDQERIKVLRERLYRMIEYAIGRHDWYDNQRYQFLQIGLALMAVGASLGALLVNLGKVWTYSYPTSITIISFVFSIFGTGLILIYLYNRGVQRDYPYRKIVDIRSWYFRYNFPKELHEDLNSNFDVGEKQVHEVKDNLINFLDRILEYAKDEQNFVKEDLEQVFILLLLQKYRQQQVKEMSSALFNGMKIASILLLLSFFSFVYIDAIEISSDQKNSATDHSKDKLTLSEKMNSSQLIGDSKSNLTEDFQNNSKEKDVIDVDKNNKILLGK